MRIKEFGAALLALAIMGTASADAQGLDRRIRVINHTSKRIVALYASPVDHYADYNPDMMHGRFLPVGGSIIADIDDGTGYCLYNIKAVLADGRTAESDALNVCTLVNWVVND